MEENKKTEDEVREVTLRTIREDKSMSLDYVASQIGVSRAILAYWETRKRTPSIDKFARLARLYGTTIDALARVGGYVQEDPNRN